MKLDLVNERYRAGIAGGFAKSLEARIAALRASEQPEKLHFFEWLVTQVDPAAHDRLRDAYIVAGNERAKKYLDAVSWFDQKLDYALRLGLHSSRPLRILDLGTGPGHFLVVARFFGHEALGTDSPKDAERCDLYDALNAVFGNRRIEHQVLPMQDLDTLPGRFDLVTAFSVQFDRRAGRFWTAEQWRFFLHSVKQHALKPDGVLFMTLMKKAAGEEGWQYLRTRAEWATAEREILISSFKG